MRHRSFRLARSGLQADATIRESLRSCHSTEARTHRVNVHASTQASQRWFSRELLRWWQDNERTFPWRETSDPYELLIAELLLQRTAAYKVVRIYPEFMRLFPTIETLATARLDEVTTVIRPLGMRRRAAVLQAIARAIRDEHEGRIPRDVETLKRLPGVGNYTAHAVAMFAFSQPLPLVDEVVARVYRRVFDLPRTTRAYADRDLWLYVERLMPRTCARDFALAILDFAASVCTFREPRCRTCVLRHQCASAQAETEASASPSTTATSLAKVGSAVRRRSRSAR